MDRVRSAIVLPVIVFTMAAVIAIGVGLLLLQVHEIAHQSHSPLEAYATPIVALIMVVVITAAGFIASGLAGPVPE